MSRFIVFGNSIVNADHIVRVVQKTEGIMTAFLDDGTSLNTEGDQWDVALNVAGHDHIVSIAPCKGVYAVTSRNGRERHYPVHFFGVCADGSVRPLDIAPDSVEFFDELDSYLGLIDRTGPIEVAQG